VSLYPFYCLLAYLAGGHLLTFLFLLAEKIGVYLAPFQSVDEDPLMAAVNLLEMHWISYSPHANADFCRVVAKEKG
jgi:hypothetical protein